MSEKHWRRGATPRAARQRFRPTPPASAPRAAALVLLFALGSCSGGPELTASVDTMVELESSLQCDITRFAHADADSVEGYRDGVRDGFAVSATDHRIFLDMLLDDEELRDRVAERVDVLCPPAATDESAES